MIHRRRSMGFTLIEVLIVVVIMAILAGTMIPRFLGTADDAKASTLNHNLHVVEAQLEIYRAQHRNQYPTIQDHGLPQLTSATDASGAIGASGAEYLFGPYLIEAPMNPYDGSTKVTPVAVPGQKPTGIVGQLGGWQYDATTGVLWPNHSKYYQ
jgi:general secretion pathway protein G